ncbi:GNAT family N-acetyltransferase [Paenibacillus sp. An7]|uniref:GNAT family N-acetyltransferase n=1 Tax=Paenibacillus sp. An7 TaxID=2689577 RepID=UPI001F1D6459|nr:GNAT family N-acetyltransferase [Paenibacillus sp. An7]
MEYRKMDARDYEQCIGLWRRTEGMSISNADSREAIENYLERNEGFSYVAAQNEDIIGTLLAGHDGRRGYLYHLAVKPEYRGQGIAKILVQSCLDRLRDAGIERAHIMVMGSNESGQSFWTGLGWTRRGDILICSRDIYTNPVGKE